MMPLSPAACCQAAFVTVSAGILALQLLPRQLRTVLLAYGARRDSTDTKPAGEPQDAAGQAVKDKTAGVGGNSPKPAKDGTHQSSPDSHKLQATSSGVEDLLHRTAVVVPHSWFCSYYVVSVASSAWWAWQFWRRGSVMAALAQTQLHAQPASAPQQQLPHVVLAGAMLAVQGCRRLYECLRVAKLGRSPMLLVHWALGIAFYSLMGISVWIEGSGAILESWHSPSPLTFTGLTWRVPVALALFSLASFMQNACHRHLASLKKYTLPDTGLFSRMLCPHYTCECVIYAALSIVAAPAGSLFNRSVLSGLLFVAVNLGSTALGTKQWYASKFGSQQVANKWAMIPFVF